MTFQSRVKKSRKPTKPKIRFDVEKLNDPLVMNTFKTTIGGRFAPLTMLVDGDAELDSIVTEFNKAVTATELLGKQHEKEKPRVADEILDCCGQRRDLKKKRDELERAKAYRNQQKIRKDMEVAKETWIEGQCQEVESCMSLKEQH